MILCVMLIALVVKFDMTKVFPLSTKTLVDQAYSARMAADGTLYILDSGHERLVHTDQEGNILGQILSADFGSGYMYIDGFAFDENNGIYLHGSEWDGMYLSQEYLYRFDRNGNYQDCLFSAEYGPSEVNKHRIYGLNVSEGRVRYLLLERDEITSVVCDPDSGAEIKETIPYPNAFNAVSDAVRAGELYYILNKNGVIHCINPEADGGVLTEVWNLSGSSNAGTCVPYRMAMGQDGTIYFTDIRGASVCRVVPGAQEAEVVYPDTGTLTVSTGKGAWNDALIVTEADEVKVVRPGIGAGGDSLQTADGSPEENAIVITSLQKPLSGTIKMILFAVLDLIAFLCVILLALRLIGWIRARGMSSFMKLELFVLTMLLLVSSVVIVVLMQEFSERYQDQLCSQVESAAYMVATQVDGEDIESVNTAADFDGEAYGRLCRIMQNSYTENVDFYKQIYCNILRYDGSGLAHAVAYLDQSIGTYFPIDANESKEVIRVYNTGKPVWNDSKADVTGSYLYVQVPVFDAGGTVKGVVAAGMDTSVMNEMMDSMIRQVLVALVIVILLIMLAVSEITGYVNARSRYQTELKENRQNVLPGHSVRILVFSVFTAYNVASTFLPVYLMRQSESVTVMSHELAASLPITVNLFSIGAMSLFCARLVSKMGIRKMAVLSGILSLAGNLLIFTLPYYPTIFLGLILDGCGVGLISNVLYIMITYVKDPDSRRDGFTIYNGACLSGINFGMMLGAVLAVNFGEHNVFGFIVCIWGAVILLTVKVSRQVEHLLDLEISEDHGFAKEGVPAALSEEAQKKEPIGLAAFLRSRGIMSFFVLIQNPWILFSSFVFYYVPLFCADNGYGETITSLLLILYALLSVFLGEPITEWASNRFGSNAMYLAVGLNIAAVMIYAWHPDIRTMILALVILGFSASFGKAIQQEHFMEMKSVQRYGEDKAMGVYNFTENIGESLGPIVFGRLMFMQPLSLAVSGFGGIIAALGAIHLIGSRKQDKNEGQEKTQDE